MASFINYDGHTDVSVEGQGEDRVSVESPAGNGTSSIVINPINPGDGGAPQPPQPPNASGSSSGSNIDWNLVAATAGLGLLAYLFFGTSSRSA